MGTEGTTAVFAGSDADLVEVLCRSRLFRDVARAEIERILPGCERLTLGAGQMLLSRNAPNDSIYVLVSGRLQVHLLNPDDEPATVVGVGECAGEMSVVDGNLVSADVVTDQQSEVLRVSQQTLWSLVNDSHAIARNLLYILSARVRNGNELLVRNMHTQRVLEIAATIDALTGVHNRGWMDRSFPRMMSRCAQKQQPFCILMIDIDNFKRLNDTWRHVCGDQALLAVANSLLKHVRPEDMVARYGGEEFVIGLPNTGVDEAYIVGERLRGAVEFLQLDFRSGEKLPHLTVSIGIGEMQPGQTVTELTSVADEALYRAKDGGRNRVMS